ncbi:DGQHR domain-containing protein [Herbaspirillum sp. WGmk3]|uniref:DGQHR domain-containing protein n=1 Tax=Herbaspirillum sp. WGmk3 TaxID=2919925 RepID=UPI0020900E4E|nr:DGQHR domain-containing protein [Herbaspirillum sp. WGmk3]MCO4856057.1 DGQHR domain-containing protein [Herbaspirillum sp. WGmk3]
MDYPCIVFQQRNGEGAPRFCLFEAPVGEILSWSSVPRLSHDNQDGVQRVRSDFRVKGIAKFLGDEVRNTIPTALVIALSAGAYRLADDGTGHQLISLDPANANNIFVIDGQHRLYGLNAFDASARAPIVAILDATNDEKAFQFIVINNKAAKVAPDHIRALTFAYSNDALEPRLRTAKLSLSKNLFFVKIANETEGSPFRGKVDIPSVPEQDRLVVAAAIESCISYIQSKKIVGIDDEDSVSGLFLAVWREVHSVWPELFIGESKLLSKVGMITMNRYIIDSIDLMAGILDELDLSNEEDVTTATRKVLRLQTSKFWSSEWSSTISDSKNVRDQIYDALRRVQQNIKQNIPWYEDVPLVAVPDID